MTNKSLQNIVTNDLVEIVIRARGLDGRTGAKGGQREIAHSLVGMAMKDHAEAILKHCGVTPEQAVQARKDFATEQAAATKKIKIAKPADEEDAA